jgi:hypothetical protein
VIFGGKSTFLNLRPLHAGVFSLVLLDLVLLVTVIEGHYHILQEQRFVV